jgi:hypothetical protein
MKGKTLLFALLSLLIITSCQSLKLKNHDFEKPVDTRTKPIEMQDKRIFNIATAGVFADNRFDGARLNGFIKTGFETYQAKIEPENQPINPSPWYAFRLWAESRKNITLELKYTYSKHRYTPKISKDGKTWTELSEEKVRLNADSTMASVLLEIGVDTLWVAAQELHNTKRVRKWCVDQALNPGAAYMTIGKSKLNRDMIGLDIGIGDPGKKDIIAILSRQHPPEVTGYLAMQAFIETILEDTRLSNDFRRKYRVLVFPLMNPDGVDLGHWRHNAGGIDLNRDWAYYRQPEVKQVAEFLAKECIKNKSELILGLDFHSTYNDVYYTLDHTAIPELEGFKHYWLTGIENAIPDYDAHNSPGPANSPTSKNWFFRQFDAEGITFEIGDDTPRDFIEVKGRAAAIEMMELLIFKN